MAKATGHDVVVGAPRLGDTTKYVRAERIPIYDVHTRVRRDREGKPVFGEDGSPVYDEVDADQLATICRNTADRIEAGEFPLIFIGHTDDDGPETEQPPVAGYVAKVELDQYRGRPTIYADLVFKRAYEDAIDEYPRRSAEVVRKLDSHGFISDLALLKRLSARPLGVISRNHDDEVTDVERYECPCGGSDPEECSCAKDNNSMTSDEMGQLATTVADAVTKSMIALFEHVGESAEPDGDEGASPAPPAATSDQGDAPPPDREEAGAASATDTAPPSDDVADDEDKEKNCSMKKDNYREIDENLTISRYRADLKARDELIAQLKTRLDAKDSSERKARHAAVLTGLRGEGFEFDLQKEVDRCAAMDDDVFDGHVALIRENYRQLPGTDTGLIRTSDDRRRQPSGGSVVPEADDDLVGADQLTAADVQEMARYAAKHGVQGKDVLANVRNYLAEKKKRQAAG